MFTFESECVRKFGEQLGQELWQAVNQAFDTMPIAAIVDSKIFCCHGGIPPPWLCPVASAINSIPSPLHEPDVQSPLAWEIMWNDPIRNTNLTETAMMELMANEGFALNARRGTGHIFSVEALERFLTINSFSHVVRAHEVAQSGFNVQQNGKLLTVFSSSKYCGAANEAACIVCDQRKIRVLRITTT